MWFSPEGPDFSRVNFLVLIIIHGVAWIVLQDLNHLKEQETGIMGHEGPGFLQENYHLHLMPSPS